MKYDDVAISVCRQTALSVVISFFKLPVIFGVYYRLNTIEKGEGNGSGRSLSFDWR